MEPDFALDLPRMDLLRVEDFYCAYWLLPILSMRERVWEMSLLPLSSASCFCFASLSATEPKPEIL